MGMMFKNDIPYAGVPNKMDAATVNGHTVEADVPADAAFTDTTNSDIIAEGNPLILTDLQGGVPFSKITIKGENISGQEMTLTATGKNQLPITVTSGTGAGVTYTVDNGEISVNGTTTGVATITVSAPNMTITQDMRLSYRGNLSGMTPKATVLRNGETVYPTPNDTTGSKLLAGDVLQNVYIQQQSADVAVSGSAKFQLEYGTEVTEYEKYSSETYTFTLDSVDYVIPTDITQKEDINVLSIDVENVVLSVTGVRTNAAIAKLWNKSGAGYDDTEIKEDIEELRNSIPSTVRVKTGDFTTNSGGYVEAISLSGIGNNIVDAIYYDNYLFAVTKEQPILYVANLSGSTMQIQCQGGDNSGFKKVAVCKDMNGNYIVFLTSVNNIVFVGTVDMNANTLFFTRDIPEALIAIQYGKNVLVLTESGRIQINNSNGDVINFNQELGVIYLEELMNISDFRLFDNTTIAIKGMNSMDMEIYHIYDMSTGARWFFMDITDENMTFTIDNIIAVGFYRDNLIIYSDQGMFYTVPNGSFYQPLATIMEKDETANIVKVRSYSVPFSPMDFSADNANMDVVGEYLVLMGQSEIAIYSPNFMPKTVHCNDTYKAFDGGDGIYFITPRECVMVEYETEEVNLAEAFMRLG